MFHLSSDPWEKWELKDPQVSLLFNLFWRVLNAAIFIRKVFIASACMLLKGLVFNNHVAWNSVAIFYRFTCCQIEGKKCWGGCASAVWRVWKGDFVYTVLQMDPFHPTKQDLSTFIHKVIRECLIYPLVCNQLRSLLFFLFFFIESCLSVLTRAKLFRGKKLPGDYEIKVEQVCVLPSLWYPFYYVKEMFITLTFCVSLWSSSGWIQWDQRRGSCQRDLHR